MTLGGVLVNGLVFSFVAMFFSGMYLVHLENYQMTLRDFHGLSDSWAEHRLKYLDRYFLAVASSVILFLLLCTADQSFSSDVFWNWVIGLAILGSFVGVMQVRRCTRAYAEFLRINGTCPSVTGKVERFFHIAGATFYVINGVPYLAPQTCRAKTGDTVRVWVNSSPEKEDLRALLMLHVVPKQEGLNDFPSEEERKRGETFRPTVN